MLKLTFIRIKIEKMDYILIGIAAVVILAALMYFKNRLRPARGKMRSGGSSSGTDGLVQCPVCGMPLAAGENLASKVFRPMDVNDQLCVVYGCPHCYPVREAGVTRRCPVCRQEVAQDGYLIARLFNKTKSGTKHIIINGCGRCNKTRPS